SDTLRVSSLPDSVPNRINHTHQTEKNIFVYPNPINSSDDLHIESPTSDIATIRIVNAFGFTVYQSKNLSNEKLRKHNVSISNIANGIYLVIVETASGNLTKKIAIHS